MPNSGKTSTFPELKNTLNPELEKAGRVADFMELGQLMAMDALEREESCGGHFRVEHQTKDGEAKRDDQNFFPYPHGSGLATASMMPYCTKSRWFTRKRKFNSVRTSKGVRPFLMSIQNIKRKK